MNSGLKKDEILGFEQSIDFINSLKLKNMSLSEAIFYLNLRTKLCFLVEDKHRILKATVMNHTLNKICIGDVLQKQLDTFLLQVEPEHI